MRKIEIDVDRVYSRYSEKGSGHYGGVWIGDELVFECDISSMVGRYTGYTNDDIDRYIATQFGLKLKEVLSEK